MKTRPSFSGLLHADPKITVFDGPPAEELARNLGFFEAMRDCAGALVKQSGTSQRAVSTYIRGQRIIAAVYWDGFPEEKDNGLVCCVAHCAKPEDLPVALLKLSEFFSCAIHQHPCPYATN
jgi:hypothetical protein